MVRQAVRWKKSNTNRGLLLGECHAGDGAAPCLIVGHNGWSSHLIGRPNALLRNVRALPIKEERELK
mgnify:CR=1 FL=1